MYNPGQNLLAGTSSGVVGTVLIPTQFVWPHGGREVFISGSFTRWSEPIRMSPVDGCPNTFQVIYGVTPGYHQYKFLVDGEWRHDECQPYGTGDYGVVNIILLAKVPNLLPAIVVPEAPEFRSLMDVDNDAFRDVATSSDGLEVSRDRISAYLSHHTAYELLPESGKVIALDVTLPVKKAFHILYEQGIPMAPLWDSSKGQFTGVLSPLDFILIFRELTSHRSNLTEEELKRHTLYAWKKDKLRLNRQIGQNDEVLPRSLVHANSTVSLKDLSLIFLQNGVSTVPIIESSSQLAHLASLSDILKCIWRHFKYSFSLLPILQQPICLIPLGTWDPKFGKNQRPLVTLGPNEPLSVALSLLIQAQVSSIPIVDNCGSLLYVYSRSDITALAKDKAYAQISIDQISIHQALQLGQYPDSPYGKHYQLCLHSDSLHKVVEKMTSPGVRRVIIVEAGTNRVEGIVTLSDVFRFLLG